MTGPVPGCLATLMPRHPNLMGHFLHVTSNTQYEWPIIALPYYYYYFLVPFLLCSNLLMEENRMITLTI